MKTISTEMREHLDSDVTALCTCWKIVRQDGKTLRFTDSDIDLTVEGELYKSVGAYTRTAIESTATLSVDNLNVKGMADSLSLPIEELRAGAFDHATVYMSMAAWQNPSAGMMKLRKGFFGEVKAVSNGTFEVELRGLLQKLAHNSIEIFSPTCRNDLGDSRCKVELSHPFTERGTQIILPLRDSQFEEIGAEGSNAVSAWYDPTLSGEVLTTTAPTRTGTYAAVGGSDGYLQQDILLSDMGDGFERSMEADAVSFSLFGWRRDSSGKGQLSVSFLDDRQRPVRGASYAANGRHYLPLTQPAILTGDYTVEAWFRANQILGQNSTLVYGNATAVNSSGENVTYTYKLFTQPDTHYLAFYYKASGASGGTTEQTLFAVPYHIDVDLEWHHVALVRDGEQLALYIDARKVTEVTLDTTVAAMPLVVSSFLGQSSDSRASVDIDDARIWAEARTQGDIAYNRFHDLPSGTANLSYYFPFEGDLLNYGTQNEGDITSSYVTFKQDSPPVWASYRGGASLDQTTGFQNVGDVWTRVEIGGALPPRAAYMRIKFEAQDFNGSAAGAVLDSMYGYFFDATSTEQVPDLTDTTERWMKAGVVIGGGDPRTFEAEIVEPRAIDGWFSGGLVTFYSGQNKGASMEVKNWTQASGKVELYLSLPYPVAEGDIFTIYPGCDKSRICCTLLFENIVNMFATPDVPGEDELFRYPDAK